MLRHGQYGQLTWLRGHSRSPHLTCFKPRSCAGHDYSSSSSNTSAFVNGCVERACQVCRLSIGEARKHKVTVQREKCPLTVQHLVGALRRSHWEGLDNDWQSEKALDKRMTLLAILVDYDGSLRACNVARRSKSHTTRGQDVVFVTNERVVKTARHTHS